jgi:hypothetical protein
MNDKNLKDNLDEVNKFGENLHQFMKKQKISNFNLLISLLYAASRIGIDSEASKEIVFKNFDIIWGGTEKILLKFMKEKQNQEKHEN